MHSRDSAYLIEKGYIHIIKDTIGLDDQDEEDALDKIKKDKEANNKQPKKDSSNTKLKDKPQAILPEEKKKGEVKDSLKQHQ